MKTQSLKEKLVAYFTSGRQVQKSRRLCSQPIGGEWKHHCVSFMGKALSTYAIFLSGWGLPLSQVRFPIFQALELRHVSRRLLPDCASQRLARAKHGSRPHNPVDPRMLTGDSCCLTQFCVNHGHCPQPPFSFPELSLSVGSLWIGSSLQARGCYFLSMCIICLIPLIFCLLSKNFSVFLVF